MVLWDNLDALCTEQLLLFRVRDLELVWASLTTFCRRNLTICTLHFWRASCTAMVQLSEPSPPLIKRVALYNWLFRTVAALRTAFYLDNSSVAALDHNGSIEKSVEETLSVTVLILMQRYIHVRVQSTLPCR